MSQHSDEMVGESLEMEEEENQEPMELNHQDPQESYELYKQLTKDLEFVQMLGDINYLQQLHTRGYFFDKKFQQYLSGLSYLFQRHWKKLLGSPQGLWNLRTLQRQGFTQSIKNPQVFGRFLKHCAERNARLYTGYK